MNTSLPVSTTRMTTEQLIRACAKQGVDVSVTQLARWVREGLILDELRQRHGRGRGSGTEWLWEAECVPRAVTIGRSLAQDRSLLHAARELAAAGYAPAPHVLREVLLECVAIYERIMTARQTYIGSDHPQKEQYRRFRRHMRQRSPDMPDDTFDSFTDYVGALLGIIPNDALIPESIRQIQQYVSLSPMKERLETVDESLLLEKYEEAGGLTAELVPAIVGLFNEILFPLAKQLLEKKGQETSTLPTHIDLHRLEKEIQIEDGRVITTNLGVGTLRLYMTIGLLVVPSDIEIQFQWTMTLLRIISDLLKYLGFSPNTIPALFEATKKNGSDEKS